ncbi:sulfotransferase [Sphingomonas histidinilytica]|uniref:sulfotransferase family protein n=1 Tax=Rhizorhabdus histidinilytica TaxID=439228 RepID=UPI001ADC68AF|nr:sulfotransferase [Rhizorhabdus histidinilytica]MBO9378007.1 sulfotransferase [Rhizorhabdus histidinilytica]
MSRVSDRATLAARAEEATGLHDFGDPWIFENLDALIPVLNDEAELTEVGVAGAETMIVTALANRLRHVDLVKRHPEILDEKVDVAAVVVGLPRTGSTMLHRMLSSAPGMTGVKWWEAQNYAPFPGEERGKPEARREAASHYMTYMLDHAPELMSIHPMSIDQSDEELIILGLLFSSTMIEGMYHVPSYARWLVENSRTRCYADLKQILQSLQWQDPARRGAKWVLKTPGHLMALDGVLDTFPEAKVVMTHRDPVQTVPSYCSMMTTLYHMASTVDRRKIGAFWEKRLAELLDLFMSVRARAGSASFIDVRYTDTTTRPVEEGRRVLGEAGIEVTPEIVAGMAEWVEANKREDRAPHRYALEDFGLTREQIERDFADYRATYLGERAAA